MTNIIIFIIIIYNNSTSSKVLTFAGPVLWAGHYAGHYVYNAVEVGILIICFYWGNWGSEWTSNLTSVTQLVCGRNGIQMQFELTPESWPSARRLNWPICSITIQD